MLSTDHFRKLALALPGAIESAHVGHPDFRVNGRVFASLGYPDGDHGMVRIPVDLQEALVNESPEVFQPCPGAWGRQGCTSVKLSAGEPVMVRSALSAAIEHVGATVRPKNASKPKSRKNDSS